jgi:hypothetical protein
VVRPQQLLRGGADSCPPLGVRGGPGRQHLAAAAHPRLVLRAHRLENCLAHRLRAMPLPLCSDELGELRRALLEHTRRHRQHRSQLGERPARLHRRQVVAGRRHDLLNGFAARADLRILLRRLSCLALDSRYFCQRAVLRPEHLLLCCRNPRLDCHQLPVERL